MSSLLAVAFFPGIHMAWTDFLALDQPGAQGLEFGFLTEVMQRWRVMLKQCPRPKVQRGGRPLTAQSSQHFDARVQNYDVVGSGCRATMLDTLCF